MSARLLCRGWPPKPRQRGFALIELLVALALGLAVLVGLSSVFVAVKQSFRFQESTGRLLEDADVALNAIASDLRMAGYAGCAGIDNVLSGGVNTYSPSSAMSPGSANRIDGANPLAAAELNLNLGPVSRAIEVQLQALTPANFIRGFVGVNPALFASGAAPLVGSSDSLYFSGASVKSQALSSPMGAANEPLKLAADSYNWRNAPANGGAIDLLLANCTASVIFKGRVSSDGSGFSVDHSAALGNTESRLMADLLFGTDAMVMPLEWSYFYIATRPGARTPSLYRVFFNGNQRSAPEEVVSNVEAMKLNFGESSRDSNGRPSLLVDHWRSSSTEVVDWSLVVAVRVGLMLVGTDESGNAEANPSTYSLLGQPYLVPTGASAKRVRKEFSTTVVLRNRVAAR